MGRRSQSKSIVKSVFCLSVIIIIVCGCSSKSVENKNKIRDLKFTVMEETELPEELISIIEGKKALPMQLSYSSEKDLFIIVGYGTQETGGYSITADELYMTDKTIIVRTTLMGPEKKEKVKQTESYPYIVLKTEYIDMSVEYE